MLGAFLLATIFAAFLGSAIGVRNFSFRRVRDNGDWREITYRYRSGKPVAVGRETFERMQGVLGQIEDLGDRVRRARRSTAPNLPAEEPESPPARPPAVPAELPRPTRGDSEPRPRSRVRRTERFRRARRLLGEGRDPALVRQITGLRQAELDLLRSSPGTVTER